MIITKNSFCRAQNVKNKKFDDDKLHKAWFTTDDADADDDANADAVFEEKQTLAPEIGRKIAGNTTLITPDDGRRISHQNITSTNLYLYIYIYVWHGMMTFIPSSSFLFGCVMRGA